MGKFDRYALISATERSKMFVEDALRVAKDIIEDTKREERLSSNECKSCFYVIGKIGGASMTEKPCNCCGKSLTFGSTSVDALCQECASMHNLCKHCGGDIDLKARRKTWPV